MNHRMHMFPFSQLRNEFDRAMSHWFGDLPDVNPFNWVEGRAYPAVNMWEQGDDLLVEAELPGLKPEELEITVVGDELTLKGQRKDEAEDRTTFHRRERPHGTFVRIVKLPLEVDADKVQAAFRDGVLTVTLPKAAAARPRKIQIGG